MVTVTLTDARFKAVQQHLRRRSAEQVAFLLLSCRREKDDSIIEVVDHIPVPPEHLVLESEWHAEVSEEFQARVIKSAWEQRLALGEVHSHPRTHARASFSSSDLFGFR